MSIIAITIENFKAIKEPVRIELKPITLLFGPNSAGKSTIVHALHYAREIFERQNLNPDRTLLGGETIDLGGFESLVYQHDKSLPIKIRFDLDIEDENLRNYAHDDFEKLRFEQDSIYRDIPSKIQTAWVQVSVVWSNSVNQPLINRYSVGINGDELAEINASNDGKQIFISKINPFNSVFLKDSNSQEAQEIVVKLIKNEIEISDEQREKAGVIFWDIFNLFKIKDGVPGITAPINLLGRQIALPMWGESLMIDSDSWESDALDEYENQQDFENLLSILIVGPGELVRDGLRKLCYVGPLREVPKRNHQPSTSPDESRWSNGLAAYDTLFFAEDAFIDQVNEWLTQEECLATGYSIKVKAYRELETDNTLTLAVLNDRILDEDIDFKETLLALPVRRRLLIRDESRNIELAPQDIGVGISQVLPVVVAALYRKTGFVIIEQPELHIHPAIQVALGDLFIEQVRKASDLTFILETHSEHLMLRLLRRIRETGEKTVPEDKSLKPEELSIYFIEQGDEGISCHSIRVDQEGDFIERWPHGFFAERAEELF